MSLAINLENNKKAQRKLLATYVNVSDTQQYTWQLVGAGVEDSAIEYNAEVEEVTDILGITETTVNKVAITQSLDPFTVRGGSPLHGKILTIMSENDLMALSQFDVMIVKGYIGEAGSLYAEVHKGCTIEPSSEGGSSTVDMPITIHYSNNKTIGTVNGITASPTFTARN